MAAKAKPDAPAWPADKVERRRVDSLVGYERNARLHSESQIKAIADSIKEFGFTVPALVDEAGVLVAGHGRVEAANLLGLETIPVMVAAGWTEAQVKAYRIADNKLALSATWDPALLAVEFGELQAIGFNVELTGFSVGEIGALGLGGGSNHGAGSLADRFMVVPFSVLNAREGWWQDRKRAWLALGIQSELGRGENLQGLSESNEEYRYNKAAYIARKANATPGGSMLPAASLKDGKTQRGDGRGRPMGENKDLRGASLALRTTTDPYRKADA